MSAEPKTEARRFELDAKWAQLWFKTAHSNVHWAKSQGWNGLNWTLVLIGAMYAVASYSSIPPALWLLLIAVVVYASVRWQVDLQQYAGKCRENGKAVVDSVPGSDPFVTHRVGDRDHTDLLIARIVIIVAAGLIVGWEIFSLSLTE